MLTKNLTAYLATLHSYPWVALIDHYNLIRSKNTINKIYIYIKIL